MKYIALTLTILFSLQLTTLHAQEDISEGKTIFTSRCTGCHAVDRRVVGPALKDVYNRHDSRWIVNFVHSSQAVIKSGDASAVKLFEENNQTVMPDHKDLSEPQIKNIMAYIRSETEKLTALPIVTNYIPEFNDPYNNKNGIVDRVVYLNFEGDHRPIKWTDYGSWFIIVFFITLLVTLFYTITYLNHIIALTSNKRLKIPQAIDDDKNNIEIDEGVCEK